MWIHIAIRPDCRYFYEGTWKKSFLSTATQFQPQKTVAGIYSVFRGLEENKATKFVNCGALVFILLTDCRRGTSIVSSLLIAVIHLLVVVVKFVS
jgi:hypothetical protein